MYTMVKLPSEKNNGNGQKKEFFSFYPSAPVWFYMEKVHDVLNGEYHYGTLNSYDEILKDTLNKIRARIRTKKLKTLDSNSARESFTSIPIENLNQSAEEKFIDTLKRCVKIWRVVMKHTNNGAWMSDNSLIKAFFAFAKEWPYKLPKTHRYILWWAPKTAPTLLPWDKNGAGSLLIKVLTDFVPRDIETAKTLRKKEKELLTQKHKWDATESETVNQTESELDVESWISQEIASSKNTFLDTNSQDDNPHTEWPSPDQEHWKDVSEDANPASNDKEDESDEDYFAKPYIDERGIVWKDWKPADQIKPKGTVWSNTPFE